MFAHQFRLCAAALCLAVFAIASPVSLGADVMLSQYSSDNTPASVLDARVQFSVAGSTLTVMVTNNTDNNNPVATYNINEVYFNGSAAVSGLMVLTEPTPGWDLQFNTSNVGSFGSFDFKLEGGNGANTPDKVAPGETRTWTFSIQGTGPFDDNDFCMQASDGSRPVIAACKFVNGVGDVVEDDDSAFGGGGMVDNECMMPPSCRIDPAMPMKITLGESFQFDVCGESFCDGEVTIEPINPPMWCTDITLRNGDEHCNTYECTPPTAGMHELSFMVTDDENDMPSMCSIMIEVNEPCDEPPTCEFTQDGPLKIIAGESLEIEVCGASACDGNSIVIGSYTPAPSFCSPTGSSGTSDGERCVTFTCSPTANDVGMHTISMIVTDTDNGQVAMCSIMIEVNAPCEKPPICTITPEGPLMAYVGEEFSFDVCGDSQCEAGVSITPMNLPDWCSESDLRFDQECLTVTCTPPNGVEGTFTFDFEIEDTENGQKTTCSVDVEVVCHLEPICYFSEEGPYVFEVGEEIDFEFCGAIVCDGHRARIEMKSRPPFIDPAGHLKGGVDEEICLPITGTPRSEDIGAWRLLVTAKDLDTGIESQCEILIVITGPPQCNDRPVCSLEPEGDLIVLPGDSVTLEACGASLCDDGTVMIELESGPEFCGPFEPVIGEMGEEVCAELLCAIPDDVEPGEYLVRFRITDLENERFRRCETTLIVEQPAATAFCSEVEPNDDFSICTMLDTNECLDLGCGANVVGLLNTNGVDLDYYCLTGLDPFTEYVVTIVGGLDCDGAPVCAALACLDENGGIINSTNSGGVMLGYPSITCVSDSDGEIQVAVSGCDDLDFDGQADNPDGDSRGGIGHGSTGSYQMTVFRLNPVAPTLSCHADMNNDGVVDSGDLGILLGVFGENCGP